MGGDPQNIFKGERKITWIAKTETLHSRSIPGLENQWRLADILKDSSVL